MGLPCREKDFLVIFVGFLFRFGRFLSLLTFLRDLGGPEWSKMIRGTHTIILVLLIPHIDDSRPISIQFLHFLETPILAYFCQNPPRGAISHFLKTPILFYPKLFGSDRDLRLEICFRWIYFLRKTTI